MKILITGVAGFIGFHTCKGLLERGEIVLGIDNINDYYDPKLKQKRLEILNKYKNFFFYKIDITEKPSLDKIFLDEKPEKVIHLAAQAGVRYSIERPDLYIRSNLVGFTNVLECSKDLLVKHLVFASSSSVYGGNTTLPFSEKQSVDHPVSLYAATKKSNELIAHTYSHLFKLPITGLRFFTVYGPWGRPDMSFFKFTHNILNNEPIDVFNHGKMNRDFTYIDDIVHGVINSLDKIATPSRKHNSNLPNPSISNAPFRIFNLGNGQPFSLIDYIHSLENALGVKAKMNFIDLQKGDIISTHSDNSLIEEWIGFKPVFSLNDGIKKFVEWYIGFYKN